MTVAPRRVLLLTDVFGGLHGGTEGQILTLVERLPADWQAELWVLQHSHHLGPRDFPCPWRVIGLPSVKDPRLAWRLARLGDEIRRARFDVIQAFHSDTCWIAPRLGRRARVPVLTSRRDLGYWQRPLHLPLLRAANRRVAGIVTNAEAIARRTIDVEHAHPDRVHVIPNGHAIERFATPADPGLRPRLGIGADAFVAGLCANVRPLKRQQDLIDALAILPAAGPPAHVLLIGTGEPDELAALRAQATAAGVASRVHLHGVTDDIVPWLKALDVGVLCSDSEGLSNAIIEYMGCGLPVVATAVGGTPELVTEGVTGHLYPVGDVGALAGHLTRLRADPAGARRLGAAGRDRFLEHLGAERMVERFTCRWEAEVARYRRPWCEPNLIVQVVRDPQEGTALLEEAAPWLDGRGFFLSPAWVTTWWAWSGAQPLLVTVRGPRGDLLGLLPLAERRAGTLVFAGQDEGADHLDVVAAPGQADTVAAAALHHLTRHALGRLVLRHVRADGALRRVLHDARHAIAFNERWATVCHEIDATGTWDGYLASRFSRKRRHELRRTVKRFLERPGARVERATTAAEVASLLPRLFALHAERFRQREDGTVFEGPSLAVFHRRLAEALLPRGELLLMALVEGDRDAAVYYAFRFHGRLLHFQSGIDDTAEATSAGTVLRACMVEHDVFGAGLEAFDFLDGDEAYKRPWATGRHDLFDLVVQPRGTRGRLAAAARGAFGMLKDEVRRRRRQVDVNAAREA